MSENKRKAKYYNPGNKRGASSRSKEKIEIRCTAEEKEKFKKQALKRGMNISQFMKSSAEESIKKSKSHVRKENLRSCSCKINMAVCMLLDNTCQEEAMQILREGANELWQYTK